MFNDSDVLMVGGLMLMFGGCSLSNNGEEFTVIWDIGMSLLYNVRDTFNRPFLCLAHGHVE